MTSGGKLVRHVMLADDDLDIDAEIVRVGPRTSMTRPTAFSPAPANSSISTLTIMPSRSSTDRISAGSRRRGRLLTRRLGNLHAFGDLDPLLDAVVVRHDEAAVASEHELADDGGVGAAQDLDDVAVGSAVALDAQMRTTTRSPCIARPMRRAG